MLFPQFFKASLENGSTDHGSNKAQRLASSLKIWRSQGINSNIVEWVGFNWSFEKT